MDRGIPTEAHLELMRARGAQYLVGTPKGRLNKLEAALAARAWHAARPEVRVKLLPEDGDLYVYVERQARIGKERSMRRKRFKRYWARLKELQRPRPSYPTLLMKLGAAAHDAGQRFGTRLRHVKSKAVQRVVEHVFLGAAAQAETRGLNRRHRPL